MSQQNKTDLRLKGSGITHSRSMRWIFTGSATLTIVALGLIILFLIRESIRFFPEYREGLVTYRQSGLEYVDLLEERYDAFIGIDHSLVRLRADWLDDQKRKTVKAENDTSASNLSSLEQLFSGHRKAAEELRTFIDDALHKALSLQDKILSSGITEELLELNRLSFQSSLGTYKSIQLRLGEQTQTLFEVGKQGFEDESYNRRLEKLIRSNEAFRDSLEDHLDQLRSWKPTTPLHKHEAIWAFFAGHEWSTSNEQQDWYGLLPLLSGSLLVSLIALSIATPFGIGAAIYVNQLANPKEQALLKPTIEFISALPAVVIGFFGVMIFGEFVRALSSCDAFDWIPFFQVQERLNAFTAGCLLALMAVPTIFTLAEDALYAVRNEIKEASFAIGATRLQTAFRVVLPSALPGIISAVLLGFGRVIGETMIVLLCAGNRVKIPELSEGLAAVFDPIHTMTGMIAQEMGEVVYGNIHYQALFMVGLVLFTLSLVINYAAETLANRHLTAQQRYRKRI